MRLTAALCALSAFSAPSAFPGSREIEAGIEEFYYRTATTRLNRDNALGLGRSESLLRATLRVKQTLGEAGFVVSGFLEHPSGGRGHGTHWTTRQAYAQYGWGPGLSLRVGKQRLAWGSGLAWNPTNRVETPKNPLNTGLEQEGALAARMDWIPSSWAGVILVAARGETRVGDLPFDAPAGRRHTAAVRARFLFADTDLALVFSGGKNQPTLVGLDLARDVAGRVSVHAEAAVYRGAEIAPAREKDTFFRLAAGLLHTHVTTSVSLEYFLNGEGYRAGELDDYLDRLDASYARATDPRLPPTARQAALATYLLAASVPYSGGLGLRRHYLHAAWTRGEIRGKWTAAARGILGLSDGGVAVTPGLGYAPRGDVTVNLDGVLLLGRASSEYRLAPLRGAVQARVKVLF